jgi:hypothetical protein
MPNGSSGTAASQSSPFQGRWRPISAMSPAQQDDEYGDLDLIYQQHKSEMARRDDLREAIQARYETAAPDVEFHESGDSWSIRLDPRINVSSIPDIQKVKRAMGAEAFWEACTKAMGRSLTAIKDVVGKVKYPSLIVTEQVGYRKVTAVLKVQAPSSEAQEKAA